jgi:hypothetical protein
MSHVAPPGFYLEDLTEKRQSVSWPRVELEKVRGRLGLCLVPNADSTRYSQ